MAAAEQVLADIEDGADVSLSIALTDLWLDVNADGVRQPRSEDLVALIGGLGRRGARDSPPVIVTFDTADAAWLAAYANLISAFAEMILAFDPTEPLARINDAEARIEAMRPRNSRTMFDQFRPTLNYAAVVIQSLGQQPDGAALVRAAGHFRALFAQNRTAWLRIQSETDDQNEWIPNDRQRSALGLEFPEGTGAAWLEVLADLEKVLNGELLLPHPVLGEGVGISLARYLESPGPIDVSAWLHGHGAVDYLESGSVLSPRSWSMFERLVGRRNSILFAVILN